MGLLPHVPPPLLPPTTMTPRQDPYHYPSPGPIYHESGSGSSVTRQPYLPGESWPPSATADDENSYPQPHQNLDLVGNSLDAHDAGVCRYHNFDSPASYRLPPSDLQDTNYAFDFPDSGYPLQGALSQDPGTGTNATYTNDDVPSSDFVNLPFYSYAELGHEFSQHQHGYTPYESTQTSAYYALQQPGQDIHTPQTSQVPFAPGYPYSTSTLLQASHSGPVYQADAGLAGSGLINNSLTLVGADTARAAGQHSHPSPVATSANLSAPGPGRLLPGSPERKRLLPLSAADEPTARRVVPRHNRGSSVHSISSGSPRRSRSNSTVHGRGLLIPQERYSTSTISSYNAPDQHPVITFNLEHPDQNGIPIIDILNKADGYNRIRDRSESFDMGKKTFTLRIQWPGYGLWSKTIAAKDWKKTRGPVTRVKLAEAVAIAIRDLFEKYRDKRYETDYERWNVGQHGIQLNQICLVALHPVSRGSWQPELCLLGPR